MKKTTFYASVVVMITLAVLAFLVARPYIAALVFGAVFAYWLHPLYEKLAKRMGSTGSALLLSILLFIAIILVVQYGIFLILREVSRLFTTIQNIDLSIFTGAGTAETWFSLSTILEQVSNAIYSYISKIVYSLPHLLISLFIFIMTFFYSLTDGKNIYRWVKKKVPFPPERKRKVLEDITGYVNAFIKVQLVIGILQGVICAIGFYFFGLRPYILLASLAAVILSIIPIIGPYLLYAPVGTLMILQGNIYNGIGLLIFGLTLGSILDYIIRPQLTGKYAKIHPLIILLGILGGIVAFGAVGIIIGPIVLSVLVIILKKLDVSAFFKERT